MTPGTIANDELRPYNLELLQKPPRNGRQRQRIDRTSDILRICRNRNIHKQKPVNRNNHIEIIMFNLINFPISCSCRKFCDN